MKKTAYKANSQMEQGAYLDLVGKDGRSVITEEEARALVCKEFGFAPEAVKILTEVELQMVLTEVNAETGKPAAFGEVRTVAKLERKPAYDATDWNYVRFEVCGWQWEMVNGGIYQVCI